MTANACQNMVLSQFQLSKITLKNLHKFKISPAAKLVLLALIDCYNPANKEIFPKQVTIAEQLGISLSSVKRVIKELATAGLIIYETKNTNRYKLTSTFFALINLTPDTVKINTSGSTNLKPTCIEHIKENKNNKVLNFKKETVHRPYHHNNQTEGINYPTTEATKRLINKSKNIVRSSPLDMDKEQALNWLSTLPAFLNDSYFAKEVRKKWNLN